MPDVFFYAMKYPFIFLFLLVPAALLTGSVPLSPAEVWAVLSGQAADSSVARFIVMEARLPQLLAAVLSGVALSVGGLVMQTLFANPLADPSLLGVNTGASLGAAVALLLWGGSWGVAGSGLPGVLLTVGASFVGACAVIAVLLACSAVMRGNLTLLVAGVMLSFALGAVITLLSFYATAEGVRSFVVWGMGHFDSVGMERMPLYAVGVALPVVGIMARSRALNALLLGPVYAANLGIRVRRERTVLLLLTGLLTALVTSFCGPIAFVGLAVPHIARLAARTADHRRLLPCVCLWGADVALLALVVSRLPGERGVLPLAAITPLVGVPVVVWLLRRGMSGS